MMMLRDKAAIASMLYSIAAASVVMAQANAGPPDATTGGVGRGVRIIAAEPAPVTPVAKPQVLPAPAPAPASTPSAAVGNRAKPIAATPASHRPAPMQPVLKGCDRPVARPTLNFADPAGFDRTLRGKLRRGGTVVVDMDTPYRVESEAPAPLGAWLNEVDKSGGIVSVAPYCQKGRGFGDFLTKLFGGGPAEPYKAARKYDAVLHVDAVDQVVTQVEFTPRKAAQ